MIVFPNCKINLGLHIVNKRADGYHNIETVFYPIGLKDALEILSFNSEFSFTVTGTRIDCNIENNLCVKAYRLLKKDFPQIKDIQMHLHKIIPSGAGLGGGSSDASFTIKLLNDFFGLHLTIAQMQDYCRVLGSDCAFFIENRSVFAKGKGDQFETININLSKYKIIIVKPGLAINTAYAYAGVIPQKPNMSLKDIIQKPVSEWKGLLINDFEKILFIRYPILRETKQKLYDAGAIYASMSGSGSALYGIFDPQNLPGIKDYFPDLFVWQENEIY